MKRYTEIGLSFYETLEAGIQSGSERFSGCMYLQVVRQKKIGRRDEKKGNL